MPQLHQSTGKILSAVSHNCVSYYKHGKHVQCTCTGTCSCFQSTISDTLQYYYCVSPIQVMKHSFEHKSPKVHSESLEWLGNAIKEFGFL